LKAKTHPAPPGWITSREIGGFHDVCVQPGYDATIRHWLLNGRCRSIFNMCSSTKFWEKKTCDTSVSQVNLKQV